MARLTTHLFTCPNCNHNYFYEKVMATYAYDNNNSSKPGVINSKELTVCCSNCKYVVRREKLYG